MREASSHECVGTSLALCPTRPRRLEIFYMGKNNMKKSVISFMAVTLSLGSSAFASGGFTPLPIQLEPITVKSVVLEGDFMPPLPEGSTGKPLTTITFQANSNGCTDANSFQAQVTQTPNGQKLAIVRLRPDHCRAYFPEGKEIVLSTSVVGFGKLFIANPLRVTDHTTH